MTHQQSHYRASILADPGRQVAQLRHILCLVEEIAGRGRQRQSEEAALDDGARISAAYGHALPIDRRRFESLAGEIAAWASAGVKALLAVEERGIAPRAAAGRLADELERSLKALSRIL